MKFRKIPVVVDAVQFTGDNEAEVQEFAGRTRFHVIHPEDRVDDPDVIAEVMDDLHSTWVGVKVNNWIIRGVAGEYYPCDEAVFANTYEPAP